MYSPILVEKGYPGIQRPGKWRGTTPISVGLFRIIRDDDPVRDYRYRTPNSCTLVSLNGYVQSVLLPWWKIAVKV